MKISDIFTLHFTTAERSTIFLRSFLPEFHVLPMSRSHWEVKSNSEIPGDITFTIESEDLTAYRATINSLVQMAHVVERTLDFCDQNSPQ